MKILSVSVTAFGKLKNYNQQFKDGLNVLQNCNGAGKTTLANFIRAMLYGFTKSKNADKANDPSRYAPWNSNELFGGSMVVEHSGETYRIERFFGKTASKERRSIINVKTGREVNLGGVSAGEYFLGLTVESYDRSAYYPQEAVEISTNDNFEQKLANLVENGAEDYNKIQQRLYDYKKKLRLNKGSGGKLYELETQRYNLQRQLAQSKQSEARDKAIEINLSQIENEQKQLAAELKVIKAEKEKLQKQLAKSQPSQEQISVRERLAELNEKLARIPQEFAQDKARLDELERQIANIKDDVKPVIEPSRRRYIATVIISILVAIAGTLICVFTLPFWEALGLSAGLIVSCAVVVTLLTLYVKRAQLTTLPSGERDALVSDYYKIAGKYVFAGNQSFDDVRRAIWHAYSAYQGDLRARDELKKAVSDDTDNAAFELNEQIEKLSQRESEISARQLALSQQQGRLTEERKNLSFDSVAIQDEIEQTENEYKRETYNYQIASEVEQLLLSAKDNLSTSYLPRLQNRCAELLSAITNEQYQVLADRNFAVSLVANGRIKPVGEFSRGIREITFLCFRIALSELLYDGEIPFIIIDDAFVNYDEENFARATQLIKQLSERGQVIYFTCHNRLGALKK